MRPEPIFASVEAADPPRPLYLLGPGGRRFDQAMAHELAGTEGFSLLCGRYEGFDDRIRQGLKPREISVGDFVCNGGEVPAMVVIDTVVRYVPGVLGDEASVVEESHSEAGKLEYPQFTRPREFRGMSVPEVLLGGNHAEIARWREQQSELRSQAKTRTNEETEP